MGGEGLGFRVRGRSGCGVPLKGFYQSTIRVAIRYARSFRSSKFEESYGFFVCGFRVLGGLVSLALVGLVVTGSGFEGCRVYGFRVSPGTFYRSHMGNRMRSFSPKPYKP